MPTCELSDDEHVAVTAVCPAALIKTSSCIHLYKDGADAGWTCPALVERHLGHSAASFSN
jgi:hypothetical protein